jgi:3-methylcrotonyl-CoA carboxylase alpha subunit
MADAGVPVVPGYNGASQESDVLQKEADAIGYPVLIKARAGGGGKGMRLVETPEDFQNGVQSAQREAQASFGDPFVIIEKYIVNPRHIEVQVFGDKQGQVVHLYERDCSLQRRHQKVIEEAPAPGMTPEFRDAITGAAIQAAQAINYVGAGTIEFIVDGSSGLSVDGFWFMEMNTRLQVEHPVTEAVTGQDLVEWQLRVASGEDLPLAQADIQLSGHAFEARIYAEDPENDFLPAPGKLEHLSFCPEARIDTGVRSGDEISPFYDPMIAKLTTHKSTRKQALNALCAGLSKTHGVGPANNIDFLLALAQDSDFANGIVDTGLIERNLVSLTAKTSVPNFAILAAFLVSNDCDPSDPRLGWQNWGTPKMRVGLAYDDADPDAKIEISGSGQFTLGDVFENTSKSQETISALSNGQKISAHCIKTRSGRVSVKFQGRHHAFEIPNLLAPNDDGPTTQGEMRAPMTGTIAALSVAVGDAVVTGQSVLVVEAMKMEHRVCASRDGVIEHIGCNIGDSVNEGELLVSLVEEEAAND